MEKVVSDPLADELKGTSINQLAIMCSLAKCTYKYLHASILNKVYS